MKDAANIYLLGFMGTGKTTVGRRVAHLLGREFLDLDDEIERREGRRIADIFAAGGEEPFRRAERTALQAVAARPNLVVAGGGGVVLEPANRADMERAGFVICLTAAPETLHRRTQAAHHRPLLEQGDKWARIAELFGQRRPVYDAIPRQLATDDRTPEQLAAEIVRLFKAWSSAP